MGPLWGHCGDAGDPPRSGSTNTAAITAISCGSVITSTGSPQLPLGAELGWGAGEGLGGSGGGLGVPTPPTPHLKEDDVDLGVLHAIHQDGDEPAARRGAGVKRGAQGLRGSLGVSGRMGGGSGGDGTPPHTHSLHQMGRQHLLADGLLCQRQPELARLQRHVLIAVLRPLQHVLKRGGESAPRAAPPPPPQPNPNPPHRPPG